MPRDSAEQRGTKHLQLMTPTDTIPPAPKGTGAQPRSAPGGPRPLSGHRVWPLLSRLLARSMGLRQRGWDPRHPLPPDPAVHTFIPAVQLALLTPEILSLSKQPCIKSRIQEWK